MVALVAVVAVAVADNLLTNLVLPEAWYVPARLTTTALVVVLAVSVGGLGAADLGLARRDLASGLRWGGGAFAAVAAVYLVGLALPTTRDLYRDGRVAEMSDATLWYTVLLAVEMFLMVKFARQGPGSLGTGRYVHDAKLKELHHA